MVPGADEFLFLRFWVVSEVSEHQVNEEGLMNKEASDGRKPNIMQVGFVTVPGAHPSILKFHAFSHPATMDDAECMVVSTITPPFVARCSVGLVPSSFQ